MAATMDQEPAQIQIQRQIQMADQSLCADAPEAQKPGRPLNVTVDAVSGGWVIR